VLSQVNVRVKLSKLKPGITARVAQLWYEYSIVSVVQPAEGPIYISSSAMSWSVMQFVFGYDEEVESGHTSQG